MNPSNATIIAALKRDPQDYTTIGWVFDQETPSGDTEWKVTISNWNGPLPITADEFVNKKSGPLVCRVNVTARGPGLSKEIRMIDNIDADIVGGFEYFLRFFKQDQVLKFK